MFLAAEVLLPVPRAAALSAGALCPVAGRGPQGRCTRVLWPRWARTQCVCVSAGPPPVWEARRGDILGMLAHVDSIAVGLGHGGVGGGLRHMDRLPGFMSYLVPG